MELRGFDSYEISLGDEMRGERASMGKSLEDAERELRIKARMIVAIEDCDLTGFTNQSVIAGYVRSYARYLGMDPEDCYRRFCEESGYKSPAALMSTSGDGSGFRSLKKAAVTSRVGSQLGDSRFAAPPSRNRFHARISLGAVTSGLALIALIAGLSYGGYALLQDIQRVGFAPLPEAPAVVAQAPEIGAPTLGAPDLAAPDLGAPERIIRPTARDYEGGGALAAALPPPDMALAPRPRRDGPISAIDPNRASVFVRTEPEPQIAIDIADITTYVDTAVAESGGAGPAAPKQIQRGIVLLASGLAWIKISERDNSTIWQGTLKPGDEYRLPEQVVEPTMRSGDAGNTYVILDGVAYGPLGASGRVAKNISLVADDIRGNLPRAEIETIRAALSGAEQGAVARAAE